MGITGGNSLNRDSAYGQDMVGAKGQPRQQMFDLSSLMNNANNKLGFKDQPLFNDPNRPMQQFNLMDILR